ncbi:hypothetical protein B0H13DRAFT_2386727 [Mycena leptocephala]|nr:hypothetical protein B0H13DRAFT_2386727 [Mycena leptocephala]
MHALPLLHPRTCSPFAVIRPHFILGAYLPFISPIALHVSSPSVFRRIRSVNLFFERLSSFHSFSALATRNHLATLLTTVIHLFSPLSRAGSLS